MTNRVQRMETILRNHFGEEATILVEDVSHQHADHVHITIGDKAKSGETHYVVTIKSEKFSGVLPVSRHRLVNELLKSEFDKGLHALTLNLSAK